MQSSFSMETVENIAGKWQACVPSGRRPVVVSIPASVPGDLVTDLQRAGKIKDPLTSNNHVDPSQVQWWNGEVYTYSKNFTTAPSLTRAGATSVRLVLNSVKMGSIVRKSAAF